MIVSILYLLINFSVRKPNTQCATETTGTIARNGYQNA